MQYVRITKGSQASFPSERSPSLDVVYKNSDLTIEANKNIHSFKSNDGRQAFLIGKIIGKRGEKNTLTRVSNEDIKACIFNNPPKTTIHLLEGSFILAVVGKSGEGEIFLDRYGQPDLYLMRINDSVVMANNLDLMPIHKSKGYSQEALAHVLTVYGYRPPKKHSIFSDISRLGVHELAKIEKEAVKIIDLGFEPVKSSEYSKEKLEDYADIFLDSLKVRGSEDGNVVYLSSGWDSSAILAGLVHVFGKKKVRAVTGKMYYSERTQTINQFELNRAKEIAEFFDVPLDIADFDYWHKGPEYLDADRPALNAQQMSSITAVNHMRLAETVKRTRKNDKESVFVGEISDGAHNLGFSQFVTIFHPTLGFREYSDKMNSYLYGQTFLDQLLNGKHGDDPIYNLLRSRTGGSLFDPLAKGDSAAIKKQLLDSFFLRNVRIPLYSRKNAKLLTELGQNRHAETMSGYFNKFAEKMDGSTLCSVLLDVYNSFHWQGSTVACVTWAGESHDLNMQLPFRDSRMIDFLSGMPEDWGRGLEIRPTKYPLKWMLENKIRYPLHLQVGPHSYLYDVDPNFSHSAELLYGSSFTPYLKNILSQKSYEDVLDASIFDLRYINRIVKNYLDGNEVVGVERNDLFSVCMLEWTGDIKRKDMVGSK